MEYDEIAAFQSQDVFSVYMFALIQRIKHDQTLQPETYTMTSIHTISAIDRMASSANGNPRYRLTFTDGTSAPLKPDTSYAYEVGNKGHRVGDTVEVTWTGPAQRAISFARPVDPPRHEHDCDDCAYLGHVDGADAYVCPQGGYPTVILRTGPLDDYSSGRTLLGGLPEPIQLSAARLMAAFSAKGN